VSRRYQAVVLDLFGTVVHFRGRPDAAAEWLRAPLTALRPGLEFEPFRRALFEVSSSIAAARAPEHHEVTSRQRFARALALVGVADDATAEALSLAHMAHLADHTLLPAGHAELLGDLAADHRLGLVSNFDHAPTACAVLARHGIEHHFAVRVISADFGRRKPHPAIFATALAQLGVAAPEALYVGDTHADDVVGALAAGMDVAWLAPPQAAERAPRATYRIDSLAQLHGLPRVA